MPETKLRVTREQRSRIRRANNRLLTIERRTFESSSSDRTYEARVMVDGKVMCACRGWTMRRRRYGEPRGCWHTDVIIAGRPTRDDGEFQYIIGFGEGS